MANSSNCTWSLALYDLLKNSAGAEDGEENRADEVIGYAGKNPIKKSDIKDVVIGNTGEKPIQISDIELSEYNNNQFKEQIDLGSGDIAKIKDPTDENHYTKVCDWLKKTNNGTVLITGGDDNNRENNVVSHLKPILANLTGFLNIDMETKLSGLSVYGFVKDKLGDSGSMLVVPIGNYDAHFILFKKESGEPVTMTFSNAYNFNEAAEDEDEDVKEKALTRATTALKDVLPDGVKVNKILFAGSFEFGLKGAKKEKPPKGKKEDEGARMERETMWSDYSTLKTNLTNGKKMTLENLIKENDGKNTKGKVNKRFLELLFNSDRNVLDDDGEIYLGNRAMFSGVSFNKADEEDVLKILRQKRPAAPAATAGNAAAEPVDPATAAETPAPPAPPAAANPEAPAGNGNHRGGARRRRNRKSRKNKAKKSRKARNNADNSARKSRRGRGRGRGRRTRRN